MACVNCKHPIHEQFKGYQGRWLCFRPGPNMGKIICQTPTEAFNDFQAHKTCLDTAKPPRWCPGEVPKEEITDE